MNPRPVATVDHVADALCLAQPATTSFIRTWECRNGVTALPPRISTKLHLAIFNTLAIFIRRNVNKEVKAGGQVVKRGYFLLYPISGAYLNLE